jgi:hypothetical protein
MKLEELNKAIEINNKINQFKKALDVLNNYDSKITCEVSSSHNNNTKTYASVEIPVSLIKKDKPLKDVLLEEIKNLYEEIKNI